MPDKGVQAINDLLKKLRDSGFDVVQVGMRWRVTHPAGGGVSFVPQRLPKNAQMQGIIHGLKAIGFDYDAWLIEADEQRKAKLQADTERAAAALVAAQARADAGPDPTDVQAEALAKAEVELADALDITDAEAEASPFASPDGVSGPRTDVIEMDAEFATDLLRANNYYGTKTGRGRTNRKFSEDTANRYAAEMVAGRWQLNHQAIGLDIDGLLVDGQHRLAAVVIADETQPGIKVPMMITYDLPVNAGDTVDQGLRRQVAHVLGMTGEANTYVLAGALRLIGFYDAGLHPGGWSNYRLATGTAAHEVLDRHPTVRDSSRYASRANATSLTLPTALTAAHTLIYEITPESHRRVADEFFKALRYGENLSKGSPVLALRDNLSRQRAGSRMTRQRSAIEHFALIIKAFNAFASGEQRTVASWRTGEPMPRVVKLG